MFYVQWRNGLGEIRPISIGASNSDLEAILGNEGCNCSKIVFDNSFWQPQVTAGILRDESLMILKDYFDTHAKG